MSNAMQNSNLVSQINQIFSSNSSKPNANTQLENKSNVSFNKVYKNEITNGARKSAEANKPPPKNNAGSTNTDKSIKAQKSEDARTQNKTVSNDEDDNEPSNPQILSDVSALFDLVDHIVAITHQATAHTDHENQELKGSDIAVTQLTANRSALTPTADHAQAQDTLNTAQIIDTIPSKLEDQVKAEGFATNLPAAPNEERSTQEITPLQPAPAQELQLERDPSTPIQMAQIAAMMNKETKPALPPITLQTPEKNARVNQTNLTLQASAKSASASISETIITQDNSSVQDQNPLHPHKSTAAMTDMGNKPELFNKEFVTRLTENKTASIGSIQTNAPITTTTLLPALPPAPGAAINGIAAAQMQDLISPRVGSKGWDQALGQKIIWMVAGEESSVQLSLNPPDLGPLQVVLSVNDHQIDASFVSEHLEVREAIEAASPKLKEMMENAGISLSGFSVSAQAHSSDNAFAQAQQQQSMSNARASEKRETSNTDALTLNQSRSSNTSGKGLVDTFV